MMTTCWIGLVFFFANDCAAAVFGAFKALPVGSGVTARPAHPASATVKPNAVIRRLSIGDTYPGPRLVRAWQRTKRNRCQSTNPGMLIQKRPDQPESPTAAALFGPPTYGVPATIVAAAALTEDGVPFAHCTFSSPYHEFV